MRVLRLVLFLCTLLWGHVALWSQGGSYTVEQVPNVYLQDSNRYVSDPYGLVQDLPLSRLDEALSRFYKRSGVEMAVVVLPSIGEEHTIEEYANELFRRWGLGSKTQNNGLLLLYVSDIRSIRFETGYGLEGVLPDSRLASIQRREMIPLFCQGQVGSGLLAGVVAIDSLVSQDGYVAGTLRSGERSALSLWSIYLIAVAIISVWAILYLVSEVRSISTPEQARQRWASVSKSFTDAILLFLLLCFPVSILLLVGRKLAMTRMFRLTSTCSRCSMPEMTFLSDKSRLGYLTLAQQAEEKLGSRVYSVYGCRNCNYSEVQGLDVPGSSYQQCEVCGVRAVEPIRRYYVSRGHKRYIHTEYVCRVCGNKSDREDRDYREGEDLASGILLGALLGSGRSGGFGGGYSSPGGSWGGGSSGGGGATSSW